MVAVILPNPDPKITALFFLLFVMFITLFILWKAIDKIFQSQRIEKTEHIKNNEVINRIRGAQDMDELMIIANDVTELFGVENDVFLEKLLMFEDDLEKNDWECICSIAETESELEKLALTKANLIPY